MSLEAEVLVDTLLLKFLKLEEEVVVAVNQGPLGRVEGQASLAGQADQEHQVVSFSKLCNNQIPTGAGGAQGKPPQAPCAPLTPPPCQPCPNGPPGNT